MGLLLVKRALKETRLKQINTIYFLPVLVAPKLNPVAGAAAAGAAAPKPGAARATTIKADAQ